MRRLKPRLASRSFFWQRRSTARRPAEARAQLRPGRFVPGAPGPAKDPLLERVWAWLHRTFPERQVYIRSNGRVQFFTFSPSLQATLAGLALIFLGWVAFATVNVVFKDRIIVAKDHRYQRMQSSYEGRLADVRHSYDALNGALASAEGKFKTAADALTAQQNAIAGFLDRKSRIEADAAAGPSATPAPGKVRIRQGADTVASRSLDSDGTADPNADADALVVLPGAPPRLPVSGPAQPGFLQKTWQEISRLAARLFGRDFSGNRFAAVYAQHPGLRTLQAQTARLAALRGGEDRLMARTQTALEKDVALLRHTVRETGIDPDHFLRQGAPAEGGPEIPLDQAHVEGIADQRFAQAYLRASAVMTELNSIDKEVRRIPLALPVAARQVDLSSGFGPRVDPFTGRFAFHPGLDFAVPRGTAVLATAPGTVVFAGRRGSYGNMVEIDHGSGIHTRYAHLARVSVTAGMHVRKGTTVGRAGSTGRSTGPHVHYEILYDGTVRNPVKFLEAGHHVL